MALLSLAVLPERELLELVKVASAIRFIQVAMALLFVVSSPTSLRQM
jgi:hypothetical protein